MNTTDNQPIKKITSRKKLLLYGCSGMGVNMLNLIVGSYLCSGLLTGGFEKNIESWTYLNKNLVVAAIWGILVFVTKVIDGVIDIPLAAFTDNLKTRFGRRRPAILIGFIPMVIAYLLFLVPLNNGESVLNTIWFALLLCVFYCFYTLTMLTFYATFSEVCETEQDTVFLSNVKSVCDVVYFILGYALVPVFVGMGINIRYVAIIFLPLSLLMLIPMFLIKEKSTKGDAIEKSGAVSLGKALSESAKNKAFMYWMLTAAVMNFGLQLFLGGINELFSTMGLSMTVIMASAFVPVPFTLVLYNKIVKKHGLGAAFKYILGVFSIGMIIMFACAVLRNAVSKGVLYAIGICGGIVVSFSIGAFFSVTYTVPSHLAAIEQEKKGISVASMYFAVQGLFQGIATGLGTGVVLVFLKDKDIVEILPLIVAASCMAAFFMAFAFPKVVSHMGKEEKGGAEEPSRQTADGEERLPIRARILELFSEALDRSAEEIDADAHFLNDLGGTSLDYYQVIATLEDEYEITLSLDTENSAYSANDLSLSVASALRKKGE